MQDGDAKLAARGVAGGPSVSLRFTAARESIHAYATAATDDFLKFMISVYGHVPPDAVEWIEGTLTANVSQFANGSGKWIAQSIERFKLSGNASRRGDEITQRAAIECTRDLKIKLAPIRLRAAEGIAPEGTMTNVKTVYNVTGPNARVNVSSLDASTNIVNVDAKQLFVSMREAIEKSAIEEPARTDLTQKIIEMEKSQGAPSFPQKYADFMQLAATHIAVFQPFLQALTQLLAGAVS